MDLPVKFPRETEVIREDVARFRALSPRERFEVPRGMLRMGDRIERMSPQAAWAKRYALEQELLAEKNTREFFKRHGY